MEKTPGFIDEVLLSQEKIVENIILLLLLAFGINLLANQILSYLNPIFSIILGISLICLTVLYILMPIIRKRRRRQQYNAFFVYNKKENKLIEVPDYEFSSDLITYMNAAFAENENLKKFWENKPVNKAFSTGEGSLAMRQNLRKFFNELTEYLILRQLSDDLEEFFIDSEFKETVLKKFERDDLPEILLKNRFLEIMSHPMSERHSFGYEVESDDSEGKTVYCDGDNGAIFETIELTLPKNCIIRKPYDNRLIIESDKISISITTEFEGNILFLPEDFYKYYLKIDNKFETIKDFQISIVIDANMKIRSLFSKRGLEYYRWLDLFLKNLNEYASTKAFFEKINWNTVKTIIHSLENNKE